MLKIFANLFWIYTPGIFQKQISRLFSTIFETKISRFFILPYCLAFGLTTDYLDQFESETGDMNYFSYSDFFKRKFKSSFDIKAETIWPCEGYVCDWGPFAQKNKSIVKGQVLDLNEIFQSNEQKTKNYYFLNIFLHNHNYHRVHSPIDGIVQKITEVPGDLIFLRPWFYKRADVSYPAVRNERFVFEIVDTNNETWYLAMVGGFGVGSIDVAKQVTIGSQVKVGQEIAKFNLGSTVCLATPKKIEVNQFLQTVHPGDELKTYENHV
jgi:phosphatidylserine decarboxylase